MCVCVCVCVCACVDSVCAYVYVCMCVWVYVCMCVMCVMCGCVDPPDTTVMIEATTGMQRARQKHITTLQWL